MSENEWDWLDGVKPDADAEKEEKESPETEVAGADSSAKETGPTVLEQEQVPKSENDTAMTEEATAPPAENVYDTIPQSIEPEVTTEPLTPVETPLPPVEPVIEQPEIPDGEKFDPFEKLAILTMVDIAPEIKKMRGIPQFSFIKRPINIIGTGRAAHIKVDDFATIKTEHCAIIYRNGQFYIYPKLGQIRVNDNDVTSLGEVINNGARIEMGSARFVFMTIV